jgi:hypothetical protein
MSFTLIQTVTLGSNQANIDFNSIPQTYTDLLLVSSMRSSSSNAEDGWIQFNGDTGGNYSFIRLYATGSGSAQSDSFGGTGTAGRVTRIVPSTYTANTFSSSQLYIPNYSVSGQKYISSETVEENNATGSAQFIYATTWNGPAAITSIKLGVLGGSNFLQHSSASLYGITKGSSGGVVVS